MGSGALTQIWSLPKKVDRGGYLVAIDFFNLGHLHEQLQFDSFAPGKHEWNFHSVFYKLRTVSGIMQIWKKM